MAATAAKAMLPSWVKCLPDKTGKGFIFDMFLQELENHEYSYTGDVQEALDALGITPQYMEAMPQLMTGLSLACNKAMQHDCFG